MSDKGIEAVSDAAQTEVTTNVGELLDADGLAGQLEMLLDRVPAEAPASEDEEKAKGEQPPDEGESSDPPEDEAKAEEEALSQTEEETAEAEPALDTLSHPKRTKPTRVCSRGSTSSRQKGARQKAGLTDWKPRFGLYALNWTPRRNFHRCRPLMGTHIAV